MTAKLYSLAYGHVMKLAMQYQWRFWDVPAMNGALESGVRAAAEVQKAERA